MPLGVDRDNFTFTFTFLPPLFSLLYSVSFLFQLLFPPSVHLRVFVFVTLHYSNLSPFHLSTFRKFFSLPVFCYCVCQDWPAKRRVEIRKSSLRSSSEHGWLQKPCDGLIPIQRGRTKVFKDLAFSSKY